MAHPTKLDADLTAAIANDLCRGASFVSAVRAHGIPEATGRYWLGRGRLEPQEATPKGGGVPEPPSIFAAFARAVDAALGEAVTSAAERVWRDNPTVWLRWSHARTQFYPVEARLAAQLQQQEQEATVRAHKLAVLAAHPLPDTPPRAPVEQHKCLRERGRWLTQHGITSVDVWGTPDETAIRAWMFGTEEPPDTEEGGGTPSTQ